jgi:ABC-type polysaccharide/polyol phosphate export permease
MAALVIAMGPLYSALFNVPLSTFFPYVALGIIIWNFLSCSINEGCYSFITNAPYLKQAPYSLSMFTWRTLIRNSLVLLHHIIIYIPIAAWAGIEPSLTTMYVLPGILITLLNLLAVITTVGFISARFRDVPQIVSSVLQLLMFVTPVFWLPESLPERSRIVLMNPFAALLDAVRSPLLGQSPSYDTWELIGVVTVINVACAGVIYRQCRNRLVYWL